MHFAMAIAERPRSLGAQKTRGYRDRVQTQARTRFVSDIVLTDDLYVRIIWFHGERAQGDIDNIIKPILDALKGAVYVDDRQIVKCVSERVDTTKDFALAEAPASAEAYGELVSLLGDEQVKHILYIEVGQLASRRIAFGPIDEVRLSLTPLNIWKQRKQTKLLLSSKHKVMKLSENLRGPSEATI